MSKLVARAAVAVLLLCLILGAAYYFLVLRGKAVDGWYRHVPISQEEGPAETAAKQAFLSDSASAEARYEALFRYFAAGAVDYVSPLGARIHYHGAGSINGYSMNGLEGFARTGNLLAAWIASGRGDVEVDGRRVDLVAFLRRGILAGTDPTSEEYWGRIGDRDLRILEAADIARILWMTRNEIWNQLPEEHKRQIADWLLQVTGVELWDNNWLLPPVTVTLALRALGWDVEFDEATLYDQFKRHYLSDGWFYDDPGIVDYYNAWSMTYELLWIALLDDRFDRDFIRQAIKDSARLMAHLIGPQGFPVMGRSICYRTAVPAPLIAQALLEPDPVSAGLARRATDAIWRYFVANGSLQDGGLTQGYFRTDITLLDLYSGAGSCHWGLRSLVLAFLHPEGSEFWRAPEVPLPVELADYRLELDELGWIVEGDKASGEIRITIPKNSGNDVPIVRYDLENRLYEMVIQRPHRPGNAAVKYDRGSYSSAKPFWED